MTAAVRTCALPSMRELSPGEALAVWSLRATSAEGEAARAELVLASRRIFGLAGVETWLAAIATAVQVLTEGGPRLGRTRSRRVTEAELAVLAALGALQRDQATRAVRIARDCTGSPADAVRLDGACRQMASLLTRRRLALPGRALMQLVADRDRTRHGADAQQRLAARRT